MIYLLKGTVINAEYPYDTDCKNYDKNLEILKKDKDSMIPLNRIVINTYFYLFI